MQYHVEIRDYYLLE